MENRRGILGRGRALSILFHQKPIPPVGYRTDTPTDLIDPVVPVIVGRGRARSIFKINEVPNPGIPYPEIPTNDMAYEMGLNSKSLKTPRDIQENTPERKKHKKLKSVNSPKRLHERISVDNETSYSSENGNGENEAKVKLIQSPEYVRSAPKEINSGAMQTTETKSPSIGIVAEALKEINVFPESSSSIKEKNSKSSNISDVFPGTQLTQKTNYRFKKIELLGKGTFGKVFLVQDEKGEKFAMKITVDTAESEHGNLLEVKMLKLLTRWNCGENHCIELLGYYRSGNKRFLKFPLYGPTIYKIMNSSGVVSRKFIVPQINEILQQLFSALDFLHRHRFVHTDIKTDNVIFVNGNFSEFPGNYAVMDNTEIRLIDFGLVIFKPVDVVRKVCNKAYRPPESILNAVVSYSVDVWCVGLMTLIMYSGRGIFKLENRDQNLEHLAQMEILLGSFPARLLEFPDAKLYFENNKTKRTPKFNHKLLAHVQPLMNMKKDTSLETDKLFELISQMLHLDSLKRPKSSRLITFIDVPY